MSMQDDTSDKLITQVACKFPGNQQEIAALTCLLIFVKVHGNSLQLVILSEACSSAVIFAASFSQSFMHLLCYHLHFLGIFSHLFICRDPSALISPSSPVSCVFCHLYQVEQCDWTLKHVAPYYHIFDTFFSLLFWGRGMFTYLNLCQLFLYINHVFIF